MFSSRSGQFLPVIIAGTILSLRSAALGQSPPTAPALTSPAELWVATDGNDANSGTADHPLASPAQAVRNARELRRRNDPAVKSGIRIILKGGTYFLSTTIRFRPEDSGTPTSPTTIEAAPGEHPILSGGISITGWKQSAESKEAFPGLPPVANSHVWVADPPAGGGEFRQLWIGSQKAIRARTPNGDTCERLLSWDTKKQEAGIPAALVASLKNPTRVELVQQQQWEIAFLRLGNFRIENNQAYLKFLEPESTIEFEHPWPQPILPPTGGGAFFLTNAIEFLDQPGEWFQEMPSGRIIYWPRPGEDLTHTSVIGPTLETLVQLSGTLDHPMTNISFSGIAFENAAWPQLSKTGHVPLQAGMRLVESYKLKPKGTPDSPGLDNQDWIERPPAAVQVSGAADIHFEHCQFEHLAASALDFISGTHDDLIEGNLFRDIGGNALQMGSFQDGPVETHIPYAPTDEREICSHERIANNLLTDTANEDWGCVGICVGYARNLTIEHNEVSNTSYTGISVGWGWTPKPNALRDNIIHANYLHQIATRMCDTAGIYTLSAQPGTIISENRIESIKMSPYVDRPDHWFYLYTDEGSSYITLRDNWIPDEKKILKNANGPGNLFENNGPTISDTIKNAAGIEPSFRGFFQLPNQP